MRLGQGVLLLAALTSAGWWQAAGPALRVAPGAEGPQPAATAEQIEADWLRQDELRVAGGASLGMAPVPGVTPEEDAQGAVDGVKDGKWGFHTENEKDPWWRVDLGGPVALDRVVIWNRCDGCAARNARILVSASDDAKTWKQLYQHNGTVFYGQTDGKPLSVPLAGEKARYLRLHLAGQSYFHLDEVDIFAQGGDKNIALGKPATQSSTSQWSARHSPPVPPGRKTYRTAEVIERGRKLAARLAQLGAEVGVHAAELEKAAAEFEKLPPDAPEDAARRLYFQARWAVRRMALANPLMDFDRVLFTKRVPPAFPHMSDQYYGWWSRGGGGIFVLEGVRSGEPRVRCLTEAWDQGSFLRPDLSYDGKKVLFAYAKFYPHVHALPDKVNKDNLPEDAFYHLFEMDLDGSNVRKLTHGKYDDFDGRYLPDGRIVFLSTRKGQSVQVGRSSAGATGSDPALPDSYVRCGGGDSRPVPVFTLHTIDGGGSNLHAISAFENFEWYPSVGVDGRIFYARWDYIDRFNGPFMSLWSTSPDGTNPQLVYGNFTVRPQCVFEPRAVPGSKKLVFTAAAHHSNIGGSLVLFDRAQGTEFERPLTRITPEVVFPETEGWPRHYYAGPWPLSEEFFLVAWSDKGLPPHTFVTDDRNPAAPTGIYLYDAFGNLELLHRDPGIGSWDPAPVRPRPRPPILPDVAARDGPKEGRFLLQDVYLGMPGIERGTIRSLRIVAVPPKVQPYMNNPVLGVSKEDPGKFVIGTAPVEADGSAFFRVPSGVSVFFQALDERGMGVQTMRTLTYVQPDTTLSCIGCHESRETAPPPGKAPLAALREPSRLAPGPEGSWPLRYDQLVQPVMEKHCVRCHRPDSDDAKAAKLDLTAAKSYDSLIGYADKDLEKLAFEKDRSTPGDMPARKSRLMGLLLKEGGHEGVKLDADALNRLFTWMDTYAHRQGHFSDGQEEELRRLRQQWAAMLTGP